MSNANTEENCKFKSKIGGQAVIEGLMMRGIDKASMACRLPNGEIDLEEWDIKGGKNTPWYRKTPFVRGCFNLVVQLADGYRCLNKSAEKQMEDDEEDLSKFEKWIQDKFGDKVMGFMTTLATLLGVVLAIGLFVVLPTFIVKLFDQYINNNFILSLIEGVIKVTLLVGYIYITSKIKDIAITYQYHGAEHKSIACYEAGEELTVENIKKHTRFHPRCGSNFLILVLIISILIFSLVTWSSGLLRVGIKLLFLPVVAGIAYEVIKIVGKYDNNLTKIISAPGLAFQKITTKEPNAEQIEVAIVALKAVIPVDKEEDKW